VPSPHPPWLALLARLPPGAAPVRRPLGPEHPPQDAPESAISGWSELVLDLSAGPAGLRVIHIVLDPADRPLAASDLVYFRPELPTEPTARHRQESIGGRFEADGSFRGTYWLAMATGPADATDLAWDLTPSEPLPAQVASLRTLVDALLAHARSA
jgi:hypothetical protein